MPNARLLLTLIVLLLVDFSQCAVYFDVGGEMSGIIRGNLPWMRFRIWKMFFWSRKWSSKHFLFLQSSLKTDINVQVPSQNTHPINKVRLGCAPLWFHKVSAWRNFYKPRNDIQKSMLNRQFSKVYRSYVLYSQMGQNMKYPNSAFSYSDSGTLWFWICSFGSASHW